MNICLFTEDEIARPLKARDSRAVHIKKILGKKTGEAFAAGIIEGAAGTATITRIGAQGEDDEGDIYFTFEAQSNGKPLFPLNMIIGFPRPIQLKRLLRDMAALGVQSVHLAGTELGEKSYLKSNLSQPEEIYKMLLDGTVQAGGTHVPRVFVYPTLAACLESPGIAGTDAPTLRLALDNIRPQNNLTAFLAENPPARKSVTAAIGSERGWSDNERGLLENHGFMRLGMGNRIMRTETAATVSASIILSQMGVLQ